MKAPNEPDRRRGRSLARAAILAAGLALPGAASAVEVLSAAHSPANPSNRFAVQCGRTGVMKVTAVVDVGGEIPTVLVGGVEARGSAVAMKKRTFPSGPSYLATSKKLGGKKDQWILGDLFLWNFRCREDCREIRVDEQVFAGDHLEFRFVVGAEAPSDEPGALRFAPRSTAETETLKLRCQDATSLPPS